MPPYGVEFTSSCSLATPSIRNVGRVASGIMRADGVTWQFGRGR